MQIFDEIKARGVEDISFISMDEVSGLEDGARAIFPQVIVQSCIVHLIRNSIKHVPSKDYKPFTAAFKKVYSFQQQWSAYPGAIDVWKRNYSHVEQLFDYGSAIRKIMYTTNFRKVTKKGAFPNENALLKVLYLRTKELENKWEGGRIQQWAMVMNQLLIHDHLNERVLKYLE